MAASVVMPGDCSKKSGEVTQRLLRDNLPLVISLIALIIAHSQQHGYVIKPPSRAYLCYNRTNYECGWIIYEPQSVEARKGYPQAGPVDKHIAGGGVFSGLDAIGANRWHRVKLQYYLKPLNKTHFLLPVQWVYTAPHSTSGYHLAATIKGYNGSVPLERKNLRLVDYVRSANHTVYIHYNHTIPKKRVHKLGCLLVIWDIADTANAFYQVIDYRYKKRRRLPKRRRHRHPTL